MSAPNSSLRRPDRRLRERDLLIALAARVRRLRDMRGMSRKLFAEQSQVSIPHIARLEAGQGNVSVLILDRLARALGVPLEAMFTDESDSDAGERALILEFVRKQPPEELPRLRRSLVSQLRPDGGRDGRIVLLGMRGAGKSTVGAALAKRLKYPFVELDREIEVDAGISLTEIFSKFGQSGYRSVERRMLERVLLQYPAAVIATGGGIVTDPPSYELLMRSCFTIWLHARNDVYLSRTLAQRDMRIAAPAIRRTALDSIRRTIGARRALYAAADLTIETSDISVSEVVRRIVASRNKTLAHRQERGE